MQPTTEEDGSIPPFLSPEQEQMCLALHGWMASEIVDLYRQPASTATKGHLLLACLAWGEKYINRFLTLTVPSLAAEGNYQALKNRSRIVVFTDQYGFDLLWRWARTSTEAGVPAQIIVVPPKLMEQVEAKNPETGKWDNGKVFPLLGCTQTLAVQIAARHGMAYHSLFPDHVYSCNYFRNLLRIAKKGQPAIVQSSISARLDTAQESLKAYTRDNGTITIQSRELGAIGWKHLQAQSRGNLMNSGKEILGLPPSFQCIWQGKDRLYLYCCHTNPVYLAPELCANAPVRYFSPIDCNLPYLCGDQFYFPKVEDEMCFLELSDDDKRGTLDKVSPEIHAAICWSHVKFRTIYMPYYSTPCEYPIGPQEEFLEYPDIEQRHFEVCKSIVYYKEIVRDRIRFHGPEKVAA